MKEIVYYLMENKFFNVVVMCKTNMLNYINNIKKINFIAIVSILLTITNCNTKKHLTPVKPEVQQLQYSIRYYINKTPNELYKDLGKPALYDIVMDEHNQIQKASISYNYVYNFKTKNYDCKITFFTNKEQNKIVSVAYNSEQCHYIFR